MDLKPAHRAALKSAILADPTLAAMATATDYDGITNALNLDASPVVKAWLTAAPARAIDEACNWTQFDTIQAGKRDSWTGRFFAFDRDFTRNKVRAWVTDVWGNATVGSNAEAILLAGTENASRAEGIIGGTVRTTNDVSALERDWTGEISVYDIGGILA